MVSLCDACVGRNFCGLRCSHRFAWLGVLYFIFLAALAISGVFFNQYGGPFYLWLIFCSVFRCLDLATSIFTAVRRRIDPRRRFFFSIVAFVIMVLTFLGELALTIVGLVLLSQQGVAGLTQDMDKTHQRVSLVAFFANFVTLAMFYAFMFSPCGYAIICYFAHCTESTRDDDERAYDQRRNNQPVQVNVQEPARPVPPIVREQTGWLGFIQKIGLSDLLGTDDLECVICLQAFEDSDELSKLLCGHSFHTQCLLTCFVNNLQTKTCPICRQPIETATDRHIVP